MTIVVAAAAVLGGPPPAGAGNHKPPATRLNVGAKQQWGALTGYCWNGACVDGIGFPTARRVPGDHRARITIYKDERPQGVSLTSWKKIDEDEVPIGPHKKVDFTLRKKREGGDTVWRVIFHLPDRRGHLYLNLLADWDAGDAFWHFHLKLV